MEKIIEKLEKRIAELEKKVDAPTKNINVIMDGRIVGEVIEQQIEKSNRVRRGFK